jgi:hypothetical protein
VAVEIAERGRPKPTPSERRAERALAKSLTPRAHGSDHAVVEWIVTP